ncbi:MAG TPA: hypothetical protein VFP68_00380, partial [Burkholderiaceae bacterium]|nr:hypothetical protein [Burkholderiaceae bacterium]
GFDKAFVYAVDHFRYYPPVLASADAGTQGRVRIRLSAGRAFSGDTLTVSGAPSNSGLNRTWSVIKPSVDGTGVELQDSVYKANYDGLSVSWMRYQLGGWQSQFSAVVTEITSAPMNAGVTVGTVAGSPWVQTVRPWVQIGTGLVEDLVPPIS